MFSEIALGEFLGLSWMKKDKERKAKNILSFIDRFNQVIHSLSCVFVCFLGSLFLLYIHFHLCVLCSHSPCLLSLPLSLSVSLFLMIDMFFFPFERYPPG